MPIGFTSAARNLFLLGSAGADLVTNFFKTIDQSSSTDGVFTARDIKYLYSEERYLLAGLALNSQGKSFGFHEKRQQNGTEDWSVKTQSTDPNNNVTLTSLELDSNGNLIVGGLANSAPWIARYTTAGVLQWTSTTNTGNGRYFGLAVDSDDNYYGAGRTKRNNPLITDDGFRSSAILEKYDNNGNTVWGKSVSVTGENVCFNKVDATSTSIIAAGYLGDGIGKGYFAKFDKSNGEMQWDRTLVSNVKTDLGLEEATSIEDIHVDPDGNIYLCGTLFLADSENDEHKKGRGFVIKYSAEGNLLWQQEVGVPDYTSFYQYYNISVDDNTRQVVVFGRTYESNSTYGAGLLTKLSSSGQILWNRRLLSDRVPPTLNHFSRRSGFDADPSFYYVFFTDDNTNLLNGTPDEYTFGKVSSSGNGLGAFQYEPQTGINIDYEIINPATRIGKLQDGSIRNDSSDLTSYPFSALKVSFDDYATPITNKKAILSEKDLVQRSGSPSIRPVDFMELDLGDESFDVFVPAQEELYDQVGTYSFEVPAGVTEVSAVAIGGGGGAAFCTGSNASSAGGGGGGGTAWGTFTVTPGETLTVVVGTRGTGGESAGAIAGASGGDSTISRGGTVLLNGGGGAGGVADAPATNSSFGTAAAGGTSTGSERDGGGAGGLGGHPRYNFGGGGGGGAGGYNGTGGNGGSGNNSGTTPSGGQGTGGGGGGGGGHETAGEQNNGGGGIGIYGGPINGAGGAIDSPAGGGSNGQGGQPGGDGGLFGGGGGGREDDTSGAGGTGGSGGVRIIWGAGRSFPDNAQRDFSSTETKVTDKSGKGNVGVVKGATLNAGRYWEFDGTDDYISGSSTILFGTDTGSIEAWFKTSDTSTPGGAIYSESEPGDNTYWGHVRIHGGKPRFVLDDNSVLPEIEANVTVSDGNWHHVVVTGDGSNYGMYVDGVSYTPSYITGSGYKWFDDTPGLTTYTIGALERASIGNYFNGEIGEVRIYPRALTAAAVFQNYNATKSKYINETPDTAPKIGPGIVNDSNLTLNYDFGNRATYDNAENLFKDNSFVDLLDYNSTTNGNWAYSPGPTSSTVGPNVISPVGDLTGGTIVYDGTDATVGGIAWSYKDTAASADQNQVQFADGDVVTYSVYAKIGSSNNAIKGIYLRTYSPETAHVFFLDSGTKAAGFNENTAAAGISADIVDAGNGWYRCSITLNITANDEIGFQLYLTNAGGATGFNDASGVGDTIHAWGAQVERNSSAGRLIRTYGTAITKLDIVKNLSPDNYSGTFTTATFNPDGYFDFGTTSDTANIVTATNSSSTNCSTLLGTTDSGGSCTIECWVNLDDTLTRQTILSGYDSGDNMRWDLEVQNGNLQFIRHVNGATSATGGISLNWNHVVVTRGDGSDARIRIYLNGSEVGTSLLGGPLGSGVPLSLGLRPDGTTNFSMDGKIAEVRTYTRFLSSTEVSQNFNATRGKYGV